MRDLNLLRRSPMAAILVAFVAPFVASTGLAQQQMLDIAMKEQVDSDQNAARAQTRVSQLADEATSLLGDYRLTTQQLDRIRIYNQHLQRLVNDQEAEKTDIRRQLDEYGDIEKGIVPFMMDMIDRLEQFIALDVPFHLGERTDRVERLRINMDKADITISEKYRQIMAAYQIEAAFGRDMDAYTGPLDVGDGGPSREVDFLRVGRILLAYQTPKRDETGYWDKNERAWKRLSDSYRNPVTQGLRIARKQSPPDLLRLPIPSPEQAQ